MLQKGKLKNIIILPLTLFTVLCNTATNVNLRVIIQLRQNEAHAVLMIELRILQLVNANELIILVFLPLLMKKKKQNFLLPISSSDAFAL